MRNKPSFISLLIFAFMLLACSFFSQNQGGPTVWNIKVNDSIKFQNGGMTISGTDKKGSIQMPSGVHGGINLFTNGTSLYSPFINMARGSTCKFAYDKYDLVTMTGNAMQLLHQNKVNMIASDSLGNRSVSIANTDTTCTVTSLGAYPFSGVQYAADYSGSYLSRSLVDSHFVKTAVNKLRPVKINPVPLGYIINENYHTLANLNNYTKVTPNTATFSLTGGHLKCIRTDLVSGYGNYIRYDGYGSTALDRWHQTVWCSVDTVNVNSYGLWLGCANTNTQSTWQVTTFMECYTGATGRFNISSNATPNATNSVGFTINSGDRLQIELERNYFTYTAYFTDLTTGSTANLVWNVSTASTTNPDQTTGSWAIGNVGGGFLIDSMKVYSSAQKNVDFCWIGNSIMEGFSAGALASGWVEQTMLRYPGYTYTKCASESNWTGGYLLDTSEFKSINPKTYVVSLAGNDIAYGVATATWKANYQKIVTTLKSTGASVVHLCDPPRNAFDMTPIRTWLLSTYPGDIVITGTFDNLKDPTTTHLWVIYDTGTPNGTHPSSVGAALLGTSSTLLTNP